MIMSAKFKGYVGRCKFKYRLNSKNVCPSKVTKRKATKEECLKYGIILDKIELGGNDNE